MKAPNNIKTSKLEKSPEASPRKTGSIQSNVVVQGLTEPHNEKGFIALVQARRASALKGNSIEVCVTDL